MLIYKVSNPESIDSDTFRVRQRGYKIIDIITAFLDSTFYAIIGRKLDDSIVNSYLKNGSNVLNIDACRIPVDEDDEGLRLNTDEYERKEGSIWGQAHGDEAIEAYDFREGRFPTNTTLNRRNKAILDLQSGERPSTLEGRGMGTGRNDHPSNAQRNNGSIFNSGLEHAGGHVYGDSGGASRYFHTIESIDELKTYLETLGIKRLKNEELDDKSSE